MDKRSALRILNLSDRASFNDAKQAYRKLAKQYHPDKMKSKNGENYDQKMKEINLAFYFLTPLLRVKPKTVVKPTGQTFDQASKQTSKQATEKFDRVKKKVPSVFDGFSRWFKTLLNRLPDDNKHKKSVKQTTKPSSMKKARRSVLNFSQVFTQAHGSLPGRGKKSYRPSGSGFSKKRSDALKKSYQGYQTYMAYKKKITAVKKRQDGNSSISRVEKIGPVRPVNPVFRDNN